MKTILKTKLLELWNLLKQKVEIKTFVPYFHEREIWWIYMGQNIGFEQNGKNEEFARPVLVFKKFNKYIFWGIPLTSKKKSGKFYHEFESVDGVIQVALLSQLRILDSKRLKKKLGKISKKDFELVKRGIKKLIDE